MQRLVQFMETRKRDSGEMDLDGAQPSTPHHGKQSSQSSSASSDTTTSPQSTFSSRGYSRSSASSVASSPAYRDSLDGYSAAKRPLTDVTEEPQEREEDSNFRHASHFFGPDLDMLRTSHMVHSPVAWSGPSQDDLADHMFTDAGLVASQSAKKRRSGESPLAGVTARIGTRFPSLSRKLKSRSRGESGLIVDLLDDSLASRSSSAGSAVTSPTISPVTRFDTHLPPSPARTVFEESIRDYTIAPIDIAKANEHTEDETENLARTPLLPPLLVDFPAHMKESPVHSPLPSPTVAEASTHSTIHTPVDTPRLPGLPSPPLSSRPSISSLHLQRTVQPPCAMFDIPPISMTDADDEWSHKLGHANFNIHPEPYLPEIADVESYKQLRANYDLARTNYTRHLVRTGEHYGSTSKIYNLTEHKWAEVDSQWKRYNNTILASLDKTDEEVIELSQSSVAPAAPIRIPPMNDPQGKFPELGDEDIVGPMTVGPVIKTPSSGPSRPSRKRTFSKFLQDFKAKTGILLGRSPNH